MAEFSKEYVKKYEPELGYDFSIIEEFSKLKENHCVNFVCEGFGFNYIGNKDGECVLGFNIKDKIELIKLEKLTDQTYKLFNE